MPKKVRTNSSVRKPHSAETILALIDLLDPAERKKLFGLLVSHPDNHYVAEVRKTVRQMRELAMRMGELGKEGMDGIKQLSMDFLKRMEETRAQDRQKLTNYGKGPKSLTQKKEAR